MPFLDYRTILVNGLLILGFVTVIVLLATVKRGRLGLMAWPVANLAFIASRIILSLQPGLPPIVGIILGNGLALFAMMAYATAATVILSGSPRTSFFAALGACVLAALAFFTWIAPNTLVRIEVMSLITGGLAAQAAVDIRRLSRKVKLRGDPGILVFMFGLYSLFFASRAAWYLLEGRIAGNAMPRDLVFSIEMVFSVTLLVSFNFILLVILMTRLEREITGKVLEVGESRNELQVLYDALFETAGAMDIEELAPRILDLLVLRLHARTAALHLAENATGDLVLIAQRGYDAQAITLLAHPPKGGSVAALAFEGRSPVIWTLDDYPEGAMREAMARHGLATVGGFPIVARGEILGSLTIGYPGVNALKPEKASLLATLGLQLGTVIRAARLHDQLDRANARLDVLASTDALTGLANRRTALRELERETARARRSNGKVAVIMCDIDRFKDFNDLHGHDCGDYVLVGTAGIIAETARATDIAARWGGEEFLVILGESDSSGIALAERLRKRVEEAVWEFEGKRLSVSITLGMAFCPPELGGERAIAMADEALYEGKRGGRNRVVVHGEEAPPNEPSVKPTDTPNDLLPVD